MCNIMAVISFISLLFAGLVVSSHATGTSHKQQSQSAVGADIPTTILELITRNGYPVEQHEVETEDGYLLGVYRIPYGKNETSGNASKPPVLLWHGLLDSCAAWLINTPQEALAYILADQGYDVWMGNSRGNTWSEKHKTLSPNDREFWEFTFDDMATKDVPAVVDFVIKNTAYEQVGYVGHSQGTVQMFAGLEVAPGLAEKISAFAALAPVAHVGNQTSILVRVLADLDLDEIFELFGFKKFLPSSWWLHDIADVFCPPFPWACEDFIFLLCGPESTPGGDFNKTRLPEYIEFTPAGTSVYNMAHWAQMLRNGKYEMMDWGRDQNMKKYNQPTPPQYSLTNITRPIGLYSGSHDALADPKDVLILRDELPKSSQVAFLNLPTYEHLDFTWGVDAYKELYPAVSDLLRKYPPQAKQQD